MDKPCNAADAPLLAKSRNGKNASEAIDAESIDSPSSLAFIAAILLLTTRLIWPAPMPRVDLSLAQTMAFDFTYFATRHANNKSSSSSGLGRRRVTTRNSFDRTTPPSRV